MRNLLAFLAAAVLTVVGVGWYLGWYRLSSAPADGGKRNVNIEVDTTKIGADVHRGERKVESLLQRRRQEPGPAKVEGGQEASEKDTPIPPPPGP
jgi:hypothetical protein